MHAQPFGLPTRSLSEGTTGVLRVQNAVVMVVTSWRMVISPTTGQPTIFARGSVRRYWLQSKPSHITADVMPKPIPYRIGRPKPKPPTRLRIRGEVHSISKDEIVISNGVYE